MNIIQMKVENRYNYLEHSQVEHFMNDVKYATISLHSECQKITAEYEDEILLIDIVSLKERFVNEYETLFLMVNYKLHTNGMMLNKREFNSMIEEYCKELDMLINQMSALLQIQEKYNRKFILHSMNHLKNMIEFNARFLETTSPIMPSKRWMELESYEEIRACIDETQTRIEDLQKARKRILKVWDPAILEDEYEEIIEAFQKAQDVNLKFLNTSFWKSRKSLRKLFTQDYELLNEQEYKTLYHNRQIVKENTEWLKQEECKIEFAIGKAYEGEQTSFERVRQDYDTFYSFYTEYGKIDCHRIVKVMSQVFPQMDSSVLLEKSFQELLELCTYTQGRFLQLKADYDLFYVRLKRSRDEYCFNDMRKTLYLIERIQQKKNWLSINQEKIISIFGTDQLTTKTNWKQYQKKQKGMKQEEQFKIYQSFVSEQMWEKTLQELFLAIIKLEQPIHEKLILKRAANACNLPRITPSLKKEYQQFIKMLPQEYEVVSEFVEYKEKELIELRKAGDEKRDVTMISDSELSAGILRMIQIQDEITLDQLSKIICEKLGFQRRNPALVIRIDKLIKQLKREGKVIRQSAGWRLL